MTIFSKISLIMAVVMAVIRLILFITRRTKKKNELAIKAEDKMRENALDGYILNPNAPENMKKIQEAKPVEVSYDPNKVMHGVPGDGKDRANKTKENVKLMVQLVENSELSAKKYVLDPSVGIFIGSGVGMNNVVVSDSTLATRQCRIVEFEGMIYAQNIGHMGKVILSRGKNKAYVENNSVELRSKDILIVGNVLFKIEIIKMQL